MRERKRWEEEREGGIVALVRRGAEAVFEGGRQAGWKRGRIQAKDVIIY